MAGRPAVRAAQVIWAIAADGKDGRNGMMTRTKGFTLIDLLVVIASVAILITISACMTRDRGNHPMLSCTANLNGIGKAIAMYAAEDKNAKFPLLWTTGRPEANITSTDATGDLDELKDKLDGRGAAMQNMWLLIDKGLVSETAFRCPGDSDYVPREFTDRTDRKAHRVGWRSAANFSYGLHFPYKSTIVDGEAVDNPAYLGPHLKGSFVIMADKNPSQNNEPATGVGPDKAPSNHRDDGSVYLTYGGQVGMIKSIENSQVQGDDIYTIQTQNNANPATPANIDDTYIVRHPALPKE